MAKIIEAKAIISGEGRLSKVLDGLDKKFKSIGKGAKIAAGIDGLNKSLSTPSASFRQSNASTRRRASFRRAGLASPARRRRRRF